MSPRSASAAFTADFHQEFDAETHNLLRRRFLWFTGIVGGLGLAALAGAVVMGGLAVWRSLSAEGPVGTPRPQAWTGIVLATLTVAAYLTAFMIVRRRQLGRDALLHLTFWLVVVDGTVHIALREVGAPGSVGLAGVLVTHVLASLFLPWTPRQSFRPLVPILIVNAAAILFFSELAWAVKVWMVALSPAVGVPGAAICWFRHSRRIERFKLRFLARRYGEMRQELVNARQIHESLFPRPRRTGPVRLEYTYEPMRQIGGDYLYACFTAREGGERLSVVVLDVTGHGIPAALTVNRLHGELDRVFAENPDAEPGEVLRLLNRYVHLTLATHSVYVTAFCFRVDPAEGRLEYASGGHPPAFLRAVDGTIEELGSTSFVLGACAAADFDPEPRTLAFGPGDALIAYTDGAIEARNSAGKMFGINGLRRLIASGWPDPDGGWPATILRAVDRFRHGPAADDTLIIEVVRPVEVERLRTGPAPAVAAAGMAADGRG